MKTLSVLFALQPLQNLLQAFLQNSNIADTFCQLWFTKTRKSENTGVGINAILQYNLYHFIKSFHWSSSVILSSGKANSYGLEFFLPIWFQNVSPIYVGNAI